MRRYIGIVLALLIPVAAFALPFGHGGGSGSAPLVCNTVPTNDGCVINNGGNVNTAIFTDSASQTFQFKSDNTLYINNTAFSQGVATVQMNSGHKAFGGSLCSSGSNIWFNYTNNQITISPTVALGTPIINTRTSTQYNKLLDAMQDSNTHAGDTLEITGPSGQMDPNASRIVKSNITIQLDSGVIIGCDVDEGNATLPVSIEAGAVNNFTLSMTGAQIAFTPQGTRTVALGHVNGATITGGGTGYMHDAGTHCMDSSTSASWGTSAGISISGVIFDHCGETDGNQSAATHIVYIGGEASGLTIANSGFYCPRDPVFGGFSLKNRSGTTDVSATTIAGVSAHSYTDCHTIAAVDISCGGIATFGHSGAGNGVVIQLLGTDTTNNNGGIRFGAEVGLAGNCPPGGAGYATNTVTINNAIIVLDGGDSTTKFLFTDNLGSTTGSVSNSILVCNGLMSPCNSTKLGTNITNGTGNTYYASRAAALSAGQTWATPCTGATTSTCQLPAVP